MGGIRTSESRTRVVEQTEEPASSFSHTQQVDKEWNAGLGTLSRLPLETRRKIYDLLLFDTCTVHTDYRSIRELIFINDRTLIINKYTDYELYEAGIFDFRFHNTNCKNQCCTSRSLRLQHPSSTLRNEYRDNFLASTCFNLDGPAKLGAFLISLTPREELQLRRLTLTISERRDMTQPRAPDGYAKYSQWQWICSEVPPNLTLVLIDAMSLEIPRHWMRFQLSSYDYECQPLNEVFMKLQCSLLTTEVICKEIKKRSPNAKFGVGLVNRDYSAFFHAVMAEYN